MNNTTQIICEGDAASQFDLSIFNCQSDNNPSAYPNNFQHNSPANISLESSFFLSPQTSSSSATQSPKEVVDNELSFDLSLDEIFDVDDILDNQQFISDELLDVLNDVGCRDLLNVLELSNQPTSGETSNSSVSSTPKRKYSTDSSDYFSVNSFETFPTETKKSKRVRRSKTNREERVARKKDQNKKAASRYRDKKKNEIHSSELVLNELEFKRSNLTEQIKKLQTEFTVILPLAKAAFTFDSIRSEHLNQLIARINPLLIN